MSLVPSKRVDRIYPVLPPLCLLLTRVAALSGEQVTQRRRTLRAWIMLTAGILMAVTHTAAKVVINTRNTVGAWAAQGTRVRHEAARDGNLEAVPAAEIRHFDELWIVPGDLVPVQSILIGEAGTPSPPPKDRGSDSPSVHWRYFSTISPM